MHPKALPHRNDDFLFSRDAEPGARAAETCRPCFTLAKPQVVTGLLTGEDLLSGLEGQDLGDELLLPSVMLRQGQPVFLDDMTLEQLRRQLPVPIRIVHGAADIVAAALGVSR